MSEDLSEQEQVRREKLKALWAKGTYPFPNDARVTASAQLIKARAEKEDELPAEKRERAAIAGRIMGLRLMGKAAFIHIQDTSDRVQVYLKKDDIGDEAFQEFKNMDLGDIVWVSGFPFKTKTGEPSLHAEDIRLLTKCLHPLPEKWHGLTDVEVRYRKRYVDLIVNPEVRQTFVTRAKLIAGVRTFLDERGYIEVETPMMSSVTGGATARPFITHHNALDLRLNLRIATELPLKRLVVGGLERVYELGRVFRNEGLSTKHNPEFTMIEFYQAYATYEDLMALTEEMFVYLCDKVIGSRKIMFDDREVDYSPPWKRLTMIDAVHEIAGVSRSLDLKELKGVHQAAAQLGLKHVADIQEHGAALYEIFDKCVESKLVNPTFITQFPTSLSPLSRPSEKDPRFVDRFELIIAGMEAANAFSELNDSEDQFRRFEDQLRAKQAGDEEAMDMDEDYVTALEYGLPPTAGEGIGIDRMVMLLTGSKSIRDVILFPQMRPQHKTEGE